MTRPLEEPERSLTKKFRRQGWLQIFFPIASGIFILGLLVGSLSLNQIGSASGWADASLTMMIIPLLGLGLILLVVLIALSYIVARLVGYLPTPMSRFHGRIKMIDHSTRRLAHVISRPFMYASAAKAAIAAVFRGVASLFERRY